MTVASSSAKARSPRDPFPTVSRERALELWLALTRGDTVEIELCPWAEGNGFVVTPEIAERDRARQLAVDRAFYEVLGEERPGEPCRRQGCSRGAIKHSVECRMHHFESVKRRACPFAD